jgi:hypothetical protein
MFAFTDMPQIRHSFGAMAVFLHQMNDRTPMQSVEKIDRESSNQQPPPALPFDVSGYLNKSHGGSLFAGDFDDIIKEGEVEKEPNS